MEKTFETPTPPKLDLRIPAGTIEVEAAGGSGTTEIRLDGPDELVERTRVEQHGDTIRVETENGRGWLSWKGRELHLHVRCPEGAYLGARTKSADVTARGRLAAANVASASGDVELETVDGDASAKTASGDVEVGAVGGELEVNTASGDVGVGSVGGDLRVNAVSGDLRAGECGGGVRVSAVSGDVELRDVRAGSVSVQAVSGDVEVGVRRGSRVHVDASTLSGDTRSELDLAGDPAPGDGPVVELRLKSVSGDLSVIRAQEVRA